MSSDIRSIRASGELSDRYALAEKIGFPERDATVQTIDSVVAATEHGRGGRKLEGTAHGESLVGPVTRFRATCRVEHRNAETPAANGEHQRATSDSSHGGST
jgi:hypothetical protein